MDVVHAYQWCLNNFEKQNSWIYKKTQLLVESKSRKNALWTKIELNNRIISYTYNFSKFSKLDLWKKKHDVLLYINI